MSWYYVSQETGDRAGPVDVDAFIDFVQRGEVEGATLVWTAGMENWVPMEESPLWVSLCEYFEQLQSASPNPKLQNYEAEQQLAVALALIQAKEDALCREEQLLVQQKQQWEQSQHFAGRQQIDDLEKVNSYQDEVVRMAQQQSEEIYLKQQELYQTQLAQQQYAEQLAAYQAQLEEFQAQQANQAAELERQVEEEIERRLSMGGGLRHDQEKDDGPNAQIHEQYQHQLDLTNQELEALRFEKSRVDLMTQGRASIDLERQRLSYLREKEEFLTQISSQQMALEEQSAKLLHHQSQARPMSLTQRDLDVLKRGSVSAHTKAQITLGNTEQALKAIEELKHAQDEELKALIQEREELLARQEKIKSGMKADHDRRASAAEAAARRDSDHVFPVRQRTATRPVSQRTSTSQQHRAQPQSQSHSQHHTQHDTEKRRSSARQHNVLPPAVPEYRPTGKSAAFLAMERALAARAKQQQQQQQQQQQEEEEEEERQEVHHSSAVGHSPHKRPSEIRRAAQNAR